MSDGPKGCVLQITSSTTLVLVLTLQRWCCTFRQPGERRVSHRVKLQDWTQKTSASFQDNWHIWHNFPWHWSHCCYSYSHVDVLSLALLLSPKKKKKCRCFPLLSISGPRLLAILNVTLCRNSCLCFSLYPHDCAVWQEHSDAFHMAVCFSDLWIRLLYLSRRHDPCSWA